MFALISERDMVIARLCDKVVAAYTEMLVSPTFTAQVDLELIQLELRHFLDAVQRGTPCINRPRIPCIISILRCISVPTVLEKNGIVPNYAVLASAWGSLSD